MNKQTKIKKLNKKNRTYPLVFTNNETLLTIVFALLTMGIAQVVATFLGIVYIMMGVPAAAGQIIVSVMYAAITMLGIWLICKKYLRISWADCRIHPFQWRPVWSAAAILMPILVTVISVCTPGSWVYNPLDTVDRITIILGAVFYYGIASAVVEECIFRGMIMSAVEYRFGKRVAILAPALFFGILRAGSCQSVVDVIQVTVTETAMGILFSFIVYESGSVWNAVIMHGVWNLVINGGILHIGASASDTAIFNYVLDSKLSLLTGGDLGVEASLDAMIAYTLFAVFAYWMWQKRRVRQ